MQRWLLAGFRIAFLITLATVGWLALTSSPLPTPLHIWDKANHFLAFFVLSFLLDFSFPERHWTDVLKWLVLLAYGIGIEDVQHWLGTRDFDVHDMLADAIGIAGYLVVRPWLSRVSILARLRSQDTEPCDK